MVAVDMPRKRIYIRGDLFENYYWLLRHFMPQFIVYPMSRPFWMPEPGVLEGINGWTIEHKP
jgi:hypothetical protein